MAIGGGAWCKNVLRVDCAQIRPLQEGLKKEVFLTPQKGVKIAFSLAKLGVFNEFLRFRRKFLKKQRFCKKPKKPV